MPSVFIDEECLKLSQDIVLGFCINSLDVSKRVFLELGEEKFFLGSRAKIYFRAIKSLVDRGEEPFIFSVIKLALAYGIPREDCFKDLARMEDSAIWHKNLERHIWLVKDNFSHGLIREACGEIFEESKSAEASVPEKLSLIEDRLRALRGEVFIKDDPSSFGGSALALLEELEERVRSGEDKSSIETGYASLDSRIGGLSPGGLYVLGARPGVGKSALALSISKEVASKGRSVAFFSLEMSKRETSARILSMESGVGSILRAVPSEADLKKVSMAYIGLKSLPLRIFDDGDVSAGQIFQKCMGMDNLGLIVVDYLQLLRSDKPCDARAVEVASITRGLKSMAMELEVPVLALSQLNRASAKKKERPSLSDLRESGAIEQDANVVLFLHREKDTTELIIGKNRSGPLSSMELEFVEDLTLFVDPSDERKLEMVGR